jgi:PhnB protein
MSNPKSELPARLETYLFFDGKCEEAIEFYKRAIGAEVQTLMRFKDSPEPPQPGCQPPGSENKIMHGSLKIGHANLMVSDGRCTGKTNFEGFGLTLNAKDAVEADKLFAALSEGGQVQMPLAKTFFSPRFGMVVDRFGVLWMVIVSCQP